MMPVTTTSNTKAHMASDPGDILEPGDVIGRYQLTSLLASGGMGQVWTARPVGAGFSRTVALKLVRSEMSGDENYARMFIDEATVASSIHHPNVCETYELGKHGDRLFMAMEWVAGDSLAGLLRQGESLVALDLRIAVRIIADACAGLHAAHETVGPDGALLGVVHRDISPPNILISMRGQAKVSDFGIAKARYQLHERTKTGEVKGKFAYIPPEQISGSIVDRRADVYAMGCVLYVATLGSRPFGNGVDALRKILRNEYRAPHTLREDYPQALEAIIARALAPQPAARFDTAEEMQMALEEWLVTTGKLVTAGDVAKCVKERISDEVRARNEALLSQNRVAPELLMSRLKGADESETPTAGSGLVTAPRALWVGPKDIPPSSARAASKPIEPSKPSQRVLDSRTLPSEPEGSDTLPQYSARAPERPAVPVRLSDATALVDFVPDSSAAESPSMSTSTVMRRWHSPWPQRVAVFGLVVWILILVAVLVLRDRPELMSDALALLRRWFGWK
jgi:serine/threonine protein kinase